MSTAERTEHVLLPVPVIPREDGKALVARAWNKAIRECGKRYTNKYVGSMVGVSDTRIRDQRSEDVEDLDVIPTAVEILLADHELAERFLAELRSERLKLHGAPPAVTKEQKLVVSMGAAANFQRVGLKALENGVLEPHEEPEIEAARAQMNRESDELGALFHGLKDLIR